MNMRDYNERATKSTTLITFMVGSGGEFLVSKEKDAGVIWDEGTMIEALKVQAKEPPSYETGPVKEDPFFMEAVGYCRLLFAVDPSLPNWLFETENPFEIKRGPAEEFCKPVVITRKQMGLSGNPDAAYAFYVDDCNTKVVEEVILYNINMLISQDASDADAYTTKVQIDPGIGNRNGG